jgi:trans-aconitate 2-methyltransferase
MTEWNAAGYARISGLQQAMAAEAMSGLSLRGSERVLDVGCGNGKITAGIAARVPDGEVVGVDASADMVAYGSSNFGPTAQPNLRFGVADARRLPFRDEFDLVVSFNALHWVRQQEEALRSIRAAMRADGRAQFRLVYRGERKSIEDALEETRRSSKWARYFEGLEDPYLHVTPDEYRGLAEASGFVVRSLRTAEKAWDFESREEFFAFGSVTFVAWTRRLPESEKPAFIKDVLDRYRPFAADRPGEENTFKFYQMDVSLEAAVS